MTESIKLLVSRSKELMIRIMQSNLCSNGQLEDVVWRHGDLSASDEPYVQKLITDINYDQAF